MTRATPTSVRWTNPSISERLAAFAAQQPGLSTSAAISALVDEGLRMRQRPGIVFRDGPSGRRAALAAGSDVWEVVRSLRNAKRDSPDVADGDRVDLVAENAGLTRGQVNTAIAYYSAYPDEVDTMVTGADADEATALAAWERRMALLS